MEHVRLGVIGCGGMGQNHMRCFGEIPQIKFTAASDSFGDNLKKVVDQYGVKGFEKGEDLLDSGEVDAVLIATPHYFHPTYAIAAFERGIHVLSEKPVAVTAKAAQAMNDAHAANSKLVFAVMYQLRAMPKWQRMKAMIASGVLGEIQRVHWTATAWFRTQAYYNSGGWRATWAGEGGGVLLNQCPHNLDMLCWLTGMPTRVNAQMAFGKYHDIEVEDEVTAVLDYANGATGVFIASTGEAPGNDYLEIVGDRGRITSQSRKGGVIEWTDLGYSAKEYCHASASRMGVPAPTQVEITPPQGGTHKDIHANFADAILHGTPLIAPGVEGIQSVELANAMIMSGIQKQAVNIPTDREAYEALLADLIAKSTRTKA